MPRKKKVVEEPVKEEPTEEVAVSPEIVAEVPEIEPSVVEEPVPTEPTLQELLANPPVLPYPEMQRLTPWIEKLKEASKR